MKKVLLFVTSLTLATYGWAQGFDDLPVLEPDNNAASSEYAHATKDNGTQYATHTCLLPDGTKLFFSIQYNRAQYGGRAFRNLDDYVLYLHGISTKATSLDLPGTYRLEKSTLQLALIGDSAFYGCKLKKLSIPFGVEQIRSYSLYCDSLTTLSLPATLTYMSYYDSFDCPNIEDVYCHAMLPPQTATFKRKRTEARLHVPEFSMDEYNIEEDWYYGSDGTDYDGYTLFAEKLPIDTLKDVAISYTTTTVKSTGSINEGTHLHLMYYGHLTVEGEGSMQLGKLTLYRPDDWRTYYNYDGGSKPSGSLICELPMEAQDVEIDINPVSRAYQGRGVVNSFPFDVKISDIQIPDGVEMALYRYAGEKHATSSGKAWQRLTPDSILHAYEGYFLSTYNGAASARASMLIRIPALDNEHKKQFFAYDDVTVPLKQHPSAKTHQQGWNLVGNPYPCFYDIAFIDFTSPVTTYRGGGYYEVYSPLDDHFILCPNEGFFVQCPSGVTGMTFLKEGRQHDLTVRESSVKRQNLCRAEASSFSPRRLFNFLLSDTAHTDRARLVVNEAADTDYELERDAAKMMPDGNTVPLVWILDKGIQYAIDERPLGNGEFTLGMCFPRNDYYTLQLQAREEATYDVILTDLQTGTITNLCHGGYTFRARSGVDENRFVISLGHAETGISNAKCEQQGNAIYDLAGRKATNNSQPKGVYIQDGKKIIK